MLHKEFWGLLFLAFVGWIFLASNPTDRIQHFCRPVGWTGNVATSATALLVPSQQKSVNKWFEKFEYSCQYMTWRLIYQEDYNKAMGVNTPGQEVPTDAELNGKQPAATEKPADKSEKPAAEKAVSK